MLKQSTFLRRVLRALVADGWTPVSVTIEEAVPVTTVEGVMKEVVHGDEVAVRLRKGDWTGWLHVVWQGPDDSYECGAEIIADHSMNLSDIIEPLYDAVED